MPFTPAQFVRGMDYTVRNYDRTEPVDQINTEHPFLTWLLANRKDSLYGNGLFGNPVYVSNNSNYQRYFGADQVTYNERDPVRQALFPYVNAHDGFWFDEDTLAANNIVINDDGLEAPTKSEKGQLVDLLTSAWRTLREGMQENLALDVLMSGSQSTKAVAGLDAIVSTTPSTGTVGDLAASASWWQNNTALGLAQAALIANMEIVWRACLRYGKVKPTKIFVGAAFLDDYIAAANVMINRQIMGGGNEKGGISVDASTSTAYFKGLELVWDPDFEALDALLGPITHPWTKRAYFVNEKNITLRPFKGRWMVNRKPERLPDRYVHYAAKTASFGMTTNKRNSMAVLSID
jgi:hypothetical protein